MSTTARQEVSTSRGILLSAPTVCTVTSQKNTSSKHAMQPVQGIKPHIVELLYDIVVNCGAQGGPYDLSEGR